MILDEMVTIDFSNGIYTILLCGMVWTRTGTDKALAEIRVEYIKDKIKQWLEKNNAWIDGIRT